MSAARRRPALFAPVLSLVLLGGCERVIDEPFGDGDDDTSTGGDDGPITGGDPPQPPDPTPVFDCEPANTKSCPMGQKCTAVSKGGLQNHYECVADDGALLPFEPCIPAPENGQDACGAGTVCLPLSEQDFESGRCLPGCRNDADCEPGLCTTSPLTGTNFCASGCDPALADCPPELSCRQARDRFICEISLETDVGLIGEACDGGSFRGCAPTFACMPGALVPGCVSASCCTNTCDTQGSSDQCASPTICAPLFTQPAPTFETVGACFVPA